jgi:hypothetical protein
MGIEKKENFTRISDLSVKSPKNDLPTNFAKQYCNSSGKLLLFYNSHFSNFFENSKSA